MNYCEIKYITKYAFINGALTVLYFALFYLFNEFIQCFYIVANFLSYIIATSLGFLLTKICIFQARKYVLAEVIEFIGIRLFIVAISSIGLWFVNTYLLLGKYFSLVIVNLFCFVMSYYLNRMIFLRCGNVGGKHDKKR